ncbi:MULTISPECIES: hypothetical protein [Rhizobium]|uniref:hypothetical protein n=1 Tax=Rhizobium TaxID=379 RepID=UPI001B341DCE|nr:MULTISPECIES: hypothetical protein [Rhizobium]MBX4906497.1 hypothetical protein [Rhizobium bangladeshense]MBX5213475.1 hypothetical protein [Rhizobium sp. NLR9a]MBX5219639.1 hypothetical protein [Rhizobium sp. NLR8a]MBX5230991.1 hypothetical protein [Rhizobium sp. NLR4a]MBX5237715.1 hypothetical protein [Rhizobium sp. NLR22b]
MSDLMSRLRHFLPLATGGQGKKIVLRRPWSRSDADTYKAANSPSSASLGHGSVTITSAAMPTAFRTVNAPYAPNWLSPDQQPLATNRDRRDFVAYRAHADDDVQQALMIHI